MWMPVDHTAAVRGRREAVQVVAGERAVHRDLAPEEQLGVPARDEADDEGPQLIGVVGDDLDGAVAEAVQAHEARERVRAVGLRAEAAHDRGRVHGVVEVRVPDEDAGDLARRRDVAIEHGGIRQRGAPQDQRPQRDA